VFAPPAQVAVDWPEAADPETLSAKDREQPGLDAVRGVVGG